MEIRYNDWQTGFSGVVKADIENYLGKSLTIEEQNLFNLLLPSLESFLCSQTERQFKVLSSTDSYYEKYPIKPIHFFNNYPVGDLIKIKFDDTVVYDKNQSENTLILNTDFEYDEYRLKIYNFASLTEPKNITVYYNIVKFWGEDVKLALIELIADYISSMDYGNKKIKNLSIAGLSVNFGEREIFKKIIQKYKRTNL